MSRGEPRPSRSDPQPRLARVTALLLVSLALGIWAPDAARAQRPERFALSAHAVLGVGGRVDRTLNGDFLTGGATGFAEFDDLGLFGQFRSGPLRPSPGLGLRLSFVGQRYVSVGLDVELSSLSGAHGAAARFSDVGVVLAARLPLALAGTGRLVTPYVSLPLGFTQPASSRTR